MSARRCRIGSLSLAVCFVAASLPPAAAQMPLACGRFTAAPLAAPAARTDPHSRERLAAINTAVRSQRYRVLFLGDSITERWERREGREVWRKKLVPLGVLDAGVNGDRTEHLLWRLDHGNLAGPAPRVIVMLIGTNDLGHGRAPPLAAEGIRADLLRLRALVPGARILLLGLLPRARTPAALLRRKVGAVNRMLATCADGSAIVYADIGGVLLDSRGRLSAAISPDQLHFSEEGYARLAAPLDARITRLLAEDYSR
jgi:lysophospholipase L1-like esterase